MVLYSREKCRELNYLTPLAFGISDFSAACEKCETINMVTLEKNALSISISYRAVVV